MKNKGKRIGFFSVITILFAIFIIVNGPLSKNIKSFIDEAMIEVSKYVNNEETEKEEKTEKEITQALQTTTNTNVLSGPYKVIRVIDGDTFIAEVDGEEQRVRMIGVDTPESVSSNQNKNCKEGQMASQYTKTLLTSKNVYLEFDVGKYDKYDRLLAYVYTEDKIMVNKLLLKIGYARLMTVQPNVKYEKDFYQIQKKARESKVGFWDGFEQWE